MLGKGIGDDIQECISDDDNNSEELKAALALSLAEIPNEGDDYLQKKNVAVEKKTDFEERGIIRAKGHIDLDDCAATSFRTLIPQCENAPLTEVEEESISSLLWSDDTTEEDVNRWMSQGIFFGNDPDRKLNLNEKNYNSLRKEGTEEVEKCSSREEDEWITGGDPGWWGLQQTAGGPCGVLAALQCEMLRRIMFDTEDNDNENEIKNLPEGSRAERALSLAIGTILARVSLAETTDMDTPENERPHRRPRRVRIVIPTDVGSGEVYTISLPPQCKRKRQQGQEEEKEQSGDCLRSVYDDDELSLTRAVASFLLTSLPNSLADAMLSDTPASYNQNYLPPTPLSILSRREGIYHLTSSLILTRTPTTIREDMDDAQHSSTGSSFTLTGQFGHCNQELINLLLCGCATSNVFDGTVDMGEGFVVSGIPRRCAVGYLTELESLRYCQVGSFYKTPKYPIWIVGSQSHFSVLFGTDMTPVAESASDEILRRCRVAFGAADPASNGFIEVGALSGVIEALSLHDTIGGPHNVPTLAASLEINGAGIIIWDDFWRTVSRLMTGASLATILGQAVVEQEEQQENAAQDFAAIGVAAKMSVESDAAMALALSAQWDDMDNAATTNMTVGTGSSAQLGWGEMGEPSTAATFSPSAPTVAAAAATIPKSDEEIARELQAQWNDEAVESSTAYFGGRTTEDMIVYGGTSNDLGANTLDEHVVGTVGPVAPATATKGTASSYAAANQSIPSAEGLEDINGESRSTRFSLIYYNGLRGGQACRFTVTKSEEEAVGASVALAGQGTGGMTGSSSSSNWHKLEDIVRTRWPGCGLDWHGATPPSID